jgi:glucosamine--fructose-6-phosphate aminotransferase (isomerizing)
MADTFLSDIRNQERTLAALFEAYAGPQAYHSGLLQSAAEILKSKDTIVFVGMGSSLYASVPAVNVLMEGGRMSWAAEAGELMHYQLNGLSQKTAVVAVSQSGESIETRKVVDKLSKKCPVIAVTNDENSSIAQTAEINLPILAGVESSISTKTFTNTVVLLRLMAQYCVDGRVNEDYPIGTVPKIVDVSMAKVQEFYDLAIGRSAFSVIARGDTLSSAMVGALIFKEGTALPAEAMSGATFRHGPLEIAGDQHVACILAPEGKTFCLLENLAKELVDYGSLVLFITDSGVPSSDRLEVIKMPVLPDSLEAAGYTIPLQLLTWYTAKARGRVPGRVTLVTKVTTRE